jgi:hypothetical protein
MLDRTNPKGDILTYRTHPGTTCRLLSIQKSSSEYRFQRNSKQWLKTLLTVSTGCDDDASKGALWILKALASEYEVKFIQAAEDAGYPIMLVKMDEATAAAMWFELNTLKKNSQIILAYLKQAYGTRFVPPELKIEDKLRADHFVPDSGTWIDENKETILYWTKPSDEVVKRTFARECKNCLVDIKKIAFIDKVLGGDHGQGKFRAVIKIIMQFVVAGVEPIVAVIKVGHLEAKKDTYQILLDMVTPSMNEVIKRIMQGGGVLRVFNNTVIGALELTFSNDNQQAQDCKWAMPI